MFKINFIKLCNKKGVPPTTACQSIGLSSTAFSKWGEDSVPRMATLQRAADYFGVTVEELLGTEPDRNFPLRSDHEQTVFYSYVRLKLQDLGKDWESVVSDFGYCDKLRVLYEYGLFPSDEFTRYLADEIGLHPQNLIDRIDKEKQLSHDLETIITKCDSLSPVRKNAVTAFLNAIDTIG